VGELVMAKYKKKLMINIHSVTVVQNNVFWRTFTDINLDDLMKQEPLFEIYKETFDEAIKESRSSVNNIDFYYDKNTKFLTFL
jgi:hypothetical protein